MRRNWSPIAVSKAQPATTEKDRGTDLVSHQTSPPRSTAPVKGSLSLGVWFGRIANMPDGYDERLDQIVKEILDTHAAKRLSRCSDLETVSGPASRRLAVPLVVLEIRVLPRESRPQSLSVGP